MIDVSIIIVNYNTRQMTCDCIDSVYEKTDALSFEIILVDNASIDGSKEFFEKDERVQYIYSNENLGFGKANNLGLKYAQGKYLFLLNSDTLLLNNAVKDFFDFAENAESDIACVGCLLKKPDLSYNHSYGKFPTFWNAFQEWIVYPLAHKLKISYELDKYDYKRNETPPYAVEYVTGAALFLKREIADMYGLFDPDYFMYYEETDMQLRYKSHGFVSKVIDSPQIVHLAEGSSSPSRSILKKQLPLKSLFLFFSKHRNSLNYCIFKYLFLFVYIPLVFISPYKWSEKGKYIKTIITDL